jgi:hypothetical protein
LGKIEQKYQAHTFMMMSCQVFPEMKKFKVTSCRENQTMHMLWVRCIFSKNCAIYKTVMKHSAEPDRS